VGLGFPGPHALVVGLVHFGSELVEVDPVLLLRIGLSAYFSSVM
jgi:hypothetical protein